MKTKMKMTLLLLLFPLLLFFVAHAGDPGETEFKLKCQEETIKTQVGENVTLNCKSEPQHDLTKKLIKWKLKDKNVLYYKGKDISPHQDKQFKGRVHTVSGWKVSEGKLSVEISSVNESHTGVYTCLVVNGSKCNVTLTVDKGARQDKQTGGGINGAAIGLVVLVLVVGAVAAWLIYRKRKSLLSCIGTQRGGEQDERGPGQDNQDDQDDQDDQEDVLLQAENQLPAIQLESLNTNPRESSSEANPLTERSQNAGE